MPCRSKAIQPLAARCATAMIVALLAPPLAAADTDMREGDDASEDAKEIVTVVATRTERSVDDVAATVSVTLAEDMERQLARDIADLVRFEPGVAVGGTGSRFGLTGFNIRGIGGNRVLTLIDGVRVPDEFSFGPFLSARRDYVDVDSLSRAEIARGPISSLYGSDALGGVVALRTKMPRDHLGERRVAAGFKGGYSSADDSAVGTLNLAFGAQPFSGLLVATRREGSETDNMGVLDSTGERRERPDPQEISVDNLTVKLAFESAGHTLTLGADRYRNQTDTRVLSDYGIVVYGTTVDVRDAADSRDRDRFTLGYRFSGALPFATDAQATLYSQSATTAQRTSERRTARDRTAQRRRRSSFYDQETLGASVQLSKPFAVGGVSHHVVYGADYAVTDSASMRDGGTVDANGAPVREYTRLPTRDFPPTTVTQLALFLQDEIAFLDGALLLSPGIRYDDFSADVAADPVYLAGNPGSPLPEDYADSMLSAKFGARYSFSERVSAYLRYSEGFRAPPYDDVNVGFTNSASGYKTIGNPQLESERSRGVEAGLRLRRDAANLHLAVFHNRYTNFIDFGIAPRFRASKGKDPADGFTTYQSVNRHSVVIKGAEVGGGLDLGGGFSVRLAAAYASGEDGDSVPVNTIEPLSAVLGVRYAASERWGLEAVWTLVAAKDASDIDDPASRPPSAGYGIVDVLAHARIGDRTRLDAGFFNIGDKTYRRWADSADADAPQRFTQPGFNFGATVRVNL